MASVFEESLELQDVMLAHILPRLPSKCLGALAQCSKQLQGFADRHVKTLRLAGGDSLRAALHSARVRGFSACETLECNFLEDPNDDLALLRFLAVTARCLPELHCLVISGTTSRLRAPVGICSILPHLRRLELQQELTCPAAELLPALACLTQLTFLTFGLEGGPHDLAQLRALTGLQHLNASVSAMSADWLPSGLQHLSLGCVDGDYGPHRLEPLYACQQLRMLELYGGFPYAYGDNVRLDLSQFSHLASLTGDTCVCLTALPSSLLHLLVSADEDAYYPGAMLETADLPADLQTLYGDLHQGTTFPTTLHTLRMRWYEDTPVELLLRLPTSLTSLALRPIDDECNTNLFKLVAHCTGLQELVLCNDSDFVDDTTDFQPLQALISLTKLAVLGETPNFINRDAISSLPMLHGLQF